MHRGWSVYPRRLYLTPAQPRHLATGIPRTEHPSSVRLLGNHEPTHALSYARLGMITPVNGMVHEECPEPTLTSGCGGVTMWLLRMRPALDAPARSAAHHAHAMLTWFHCPAPAASFALWMHRLTTKRRSRLPCASPCGTQTADFSCPHFVQASFASMSVSIPVDIALFIRPVGHGRRHHKPWTGPVQAVHSSLQKMPTARPTPQLSRLRFRRILFIEPWQHAGSGFQSLTGYP